MGKPSAPPPPDYKGMAEQQGVENRDTAFFNTNINRVDQVGPQGSVTWGLKPGADPNNPQAGDYIQTTTYSPEQQALYDKTTGISNSFLDTAQSGLSRVQDGLGNAFDTSQLPQMQTLGAPQLTAPQALPNQTLGAAAPASQVSWGGGLQQAGEAPGMERMGSTPGMGRLSWGGMPVSSVDAGAAAQLGFDPAQIQMALNTSGLGAMPTGGDEASRRRVEEAMMARANPDVARQEEAMRTKLLQSGLTVGSDAWNREMSRMDQTRNDLRMQAVLAGGQEESRQVGLQQGLRQQGFGELLAGGQFANSAQQQDYAQQMGLANLNNAGLSQDLQARLASAGFANQASLQGLEGASRVAGFNNQAGQQEFSNELASRAFNNQAGQQEFANGLASSGFNNQAALQDFQARMGAGGFNNQASQQDFQNRATAASFGNNATMQQNQQMQGYEQLLAALTQSQAGFDNQARQQSIQEQAYLRSLPMNEVNALRTGSQVTGPQFGSYYTGGSAAAAPVFDAGMAQASWDQNMYNQQMGSWNSMTGALLGAGGSLGAAGIMKYSDRRLKSNIVRIGTLPNGLGLYSYDMFGARQAGVIAQEVAEVIPDAVTRGDDGFLRVDYSKVMA